MINYGCQQVLIKPDKELKAILEYLATESTKLTNCSIYYARQLFLKTGKIVGKFDLINELKTNPHYQSLYSQVAQQSVISVAESFKSYKGLIKAARLGVLNQKPKLPNYRKKEGLTLVSYPKQAISLDIKSSMLRFPLGNIVATWFGIKEFNLPMPSNLDFNRTVEYRILPKNKCFYLELVYRVSNLDLPLNTNNVLGIDHGISNWLTCVSNVGTSFIVDGRQVKSKNFWYNKEIARIKTNKPKNFWSNKLSRITEKRNRQMRDAVNKAAMKVAYHCVKHNIGTVVFGWNKGQKQNVNLGSTNNQNFVQIPTGKLKTRIEQLCLRLGIRFIENEESYTSQASFLDSDLLPTFGGKPKGWQASGKRIVRGLYQSSNGILSNADCNGAANIISKVSTTLGLDLSGVSIGALSTPLRVRIWAT